jgi:inosine/xanthosine triphosphatase
MRIIVGTKNQKKIDVVLAVFKDILGVTEIDVEKHDATSGVPEAPHDEETYQGALNRAHECFTIGSANYYVGIESGLVKRYGNMFEEAWAVIIAHDGVTRIGYSSGLLLPPVVAERMEKGEKHNDIMAEFDKILQLPDDNRDTWSRYTGGAISRKVSLEESIRNALIQTTETEKSLYTYKNQ